MPVGHRKFSELCRMSESAVVSGVTGQDVTQSCTHPTHGDGSEMMVCFRAAGAVHAFTASCVEPPAQSSQDDSQLLADFLLHHIPASALLLSTENRYWACGRVSAGTSGPSV